MRIRYIDLLRQIALFYMIFQHAVLSLLTSFDNTNIIYFLFELVPICPALFLFISGFSITLSYNRIKQTNFNFSFKLIKRAIILILLASLLFFIENGLQFPDLIISSGILNTIGWMIIISSLLILLPFKEIIIFSIIIILILLNIIFQIKGIKIIPFNYGYEPMSPTIVFGFIGLLIGIILYKIEKIKIKNIFIVSLGVSSIIILTFYFTKYGVFKVFYYETGRYNIERIFQEKYFPQYLFTGSNTNSKILTNIWNYKTNCFFASLAAVLVLFSGGYFIEPCLKKLPRYIFVPGEKAFFNYFYHLAVLAIIVLVFGFNIFSTPVFLIILLLLFTTSYVFSILLVRNSNFTSR